MAQLVQEAGSVSHFQKAVLIIWNFPFILAVASVAITITVVLINDGQILTILQFALVLFLILLIGLKIYEQQDHYEGNAAHDCGKAEREIRNEKT